MATTSELLQDAVYRCVCSWVGGDPDRTQINPATCPRCLSTRKHRCKTGQCYHCDRCEHAWIPKYDAKAIFVNTCPACWHHDRKRVAVRLDGTPPLVFHDRPLPNLFKDDAKSKVMRVLRWVLQEGAVSSKDFKAAHVALGGTKLSTHAFDRYFDDKDNRYVPSEGNHAILARDQVGKRTGPKDTIRWIGSPGETFFERARGWFDRMALTEREYADLLSMLEARVLSDQSEESRAVELTWYRAAQSATPTVRSAVRHASKRASKKRGHATDAQPATQVS